MDMDLLFKHAIAKWKWITKNWIYTMSGEENYARLESSFPYLVKYRGYCSFCQSFNYQESQSCDERCPLFQAGERCKRPNSLYTIWRTCMGSDRAYEAKTAAEKLLALIKKLRAKFKLNTKIGDKGV